MGKRKEAILQNPPSDPGKALSDSSDTDAASNVGEVPQEGVHARSTPRAGSPMQLELGPEDSVTCQWEDCGVVFTHLPTLIDHIHNDHIGVHKSNYTCEWASCLRRGLTQTSRFALISHIRSHTGEKPFICLLPECDKSFTRSDALAKHMRLQHNLTPPAPGRGGARKRKRGVEEGFNTFKVDPATTAEQPVTVTDDQLETSVKQLASSSAKGKGVSGKGKRQTRQVQLQSQAAHTLTSGTQQQGGGIEDDDGYMSSASDGLPASLMVHYDRSTGLVMGESKSKVMYLQMKAKHRYVMEQNDSLSEELRDLKVELEREKVEKDSALDELLHRTLGPESSFLMPVPDMALHNLPPATLIDSGPIFHHPSSPFLQNGNHK